MKKVIRKGLFETSSSSEDSLSVYQSMGLFILSQEQYNQFKEGKLFVRFDNIKPSVLTDFNEMYKENAKVIKEKNLTRGKLSSTEISLPDYIYYNHMHELYLTYETYYHALQDHFYEVDFFNYNNDNNVIFGYYGYTED